MQQLKNEIISLKADKEMLEDHVKFLTNLIIEKDAEIEVLRTVVEKFLNNNNGTDKKRDKKNNTNQLKLNEKLKQARLDAGLDQKYVASVLELDQGKISLIEKGTRKVNAETELPKLAKLYKKPIEWFYNEITINKIYEKE